MYRLTTSTTRQRSSGRKRAERAWIVLLLLGFTAPGAFADPVSEWQQRRLFQPTDVQLHNERQGRIFIYDGLSDKVAQRAVDEQFNRVEHMMFINTTVTDESGNPVRDEETGEIVREDDEC